MVCYDLCLMDLFFFYFILLIFVVVKQLVIWCLIPLFIDNNYLHEDVNDYDCLFLTIYYNFPLMLFFATLSAFLVFLLLPLLIFNYLSPIKFNWERKRKRDKDKRGTERIFICFVCWLCVCFYFMSKLPWISNRWSDY